MVTGARWVADLATFNDLENISYCRFEGGTIIFGLEVKASYTKPPGSVIGMFSDSNKAKAQKDFQDNINNIRMVLAYWEENKILQP